MNICGLGNFFTSSYDTVCRGYNKTSEWAASFFKTLNESLHSNFPSRQKIKIYTALTLATLMAVGFPAAYGGVLPLGGTGFFINVINILHRSLGKQDKRYDLRYFPDLRPFPMYAVKMDDCLVNIPEFIEVNAGIRSIEPLTFYPSYPQIKVITNCSLDPQRLYDEGLKNKLIFIIDNNPKK